ncbi:MAG: MBL fold metallo-hydrolase [Proteobacteria bacterium]|nr:MBL fold metallo-hydrolase [Pseudomonadota bacterium]
MQILVEDGKLKIIKLSLGPYGTNSYVIICEKTMESIIIDAPGEIEKVKAALAGTRPKCILMTHSHMDHTGGLVQLKKDLAVPMASHPAEASGLPVKPDMDLNQGDALDFGEISFQVLHTPGHTPGSVCLYTAGVLISGDTLFPGGPGKTWSAAAFRQILESLETKIFPLPDETRVFPGHGETTFVKKERDACKAFVSKGLDPDLQGDVSWN